MIDLKKALKRALPPRALLRARAVDNYLFGAPELRHLKRLCDPDRVSLDIGANIGVYSFFLRRYSQHVYAYEPHPQLARGLERSLEDRVTVIASALSNRSGTAVLRIPLDRGEEQHALASVCQDFADAEGLREVEVPRLRLDDQAHDNVGFIKIDVEQHEPEVLEGAMDTIRQQRPSLLIEVTPLLYPKSLAELFAPLLDLGYRAEFCFDGKLVDLSSYSPELHNARANLGQRRRYLTNLMFVPLSG